ncbi:MAG: efflux RND transporter periplasmic adaptor subunit [Burkholderiales bacterium]|nr:efflux RND transporter periplasmic adaptor subunit [Burkholderiales bacterium]
MFQLPHRAVRLTRRARRSLPAWPVLPALSALLALLALATLSVLWPAAPRAFAADPPGGKAAGASAAARPALTVTVVSPSPVSWPQTVAANGSIFAWQEASVGSETPGWRIAEVRAQVGDSVRRGQVLAVFATELAEADLAQQRAALAEAEALLAEATTNANRARELQPSGVLSAQQTQQLLTVERTAAARLEAQRAALAAQQLRLKQAQVLAPDSGIISARWATVGAVVQPGQELFRLIRQGRLEWRAEVTAADLALIKAGQAVRVSAVGAPPTGGRVRMVAPTVDAATRNGLVFVDLLPPGTGAARGAPAGARAGMFARGEFEVGNGQALTLPQTAVLQREGFSYVFKVGAEHKVQQIKVSVGRRLGDRIEITAGLEPAARVVAHGAGFLGDGDLVRVVEAAAAATAAPGKAASAAVPGKK